MPTPHYIESLTDAINNLVDCRESIYQSIFEIAITGELSEWNNTIEIGTEIKFTKNIFEGCEDANIQILLKLMNEVENTVDTLTNINGF